MAEVHARMPVVLADEDHAGWLDPAQHDASLAIALARAPMALADFVHYRELLSPAALDAT